MYRYTKDKFQWGVKPSAYLILYFLNFELWEQNADIEFLNYFLSVGGKSNQVYILFCIQNINVHGMLILSF